MRSHMINVPLKKCIQIENQTDKFILTKEYYNNTFEIRFVYIEILRNNILLWILEYEIKMYRRCYSKE